MDVIAGLMMFIEGWYHVGDTIAIPMVEFEGVVEDVSLRRTKLRTVDGETIHVNNSQIPGVRVLPEGAKELAVEIFVSDRERGEQLVFGVESLLPHGPTTFVPAPPGSSRSRQLGEGLVRLRRLDESPEPDEALAELLDLLDPGAQNKRRRPLRQQRLDPEDELLSALAIADEDLDRQLLRALRQHADAGDL